MQVGLKLQRSDIFFIRTIEVYSLTVAFSVCPGSNLHLEFNPEMGLHFPFDSLLCKPILGRDTPPIHFVAGGEIPETASVLLDFLATF